MRVRALGMFLFTAVVVPTIGNAQVYRFETPAPLATAASADWQVNGEPIYYAGSFYFPTGPNVFFDSHVMVQAGSYRGVPLYADATLEPYSVAYVPIGRNLMRPYERRREGALAGTEGSRTPSFPVQLDSELDVESGAAPTVMTGTISGAIGTSGTGMPPVATDAASRSETIAAPRHVIVESVPHPVATRGIWVSYEGARWYQDGAAVAFDPNHFVAVGEYHGFPVYREKSARADEIYVPAVTGGPLTRYRR